MRVVSPYGWGNNWGPQVPSPNWHAKSIHQTIDLNNGLNRKAQAAIDALEPKVSIWDETTLAEAASKLSISDRKPSLARKLTEAAPGLKNGENA